MKRLTEMDTVLCGPDTEIRDVIARIDASTPHLFQVVVAADQTVLGTLTDGDIRRGFARGMDLSATARDCMHTPPTLGVLGDDPDNRRRLHGKRFLPVCGPDGRLDHILLEPERGRAITRALVMAGGYGKRLGHRTRNTPKPLLPVGGKPILGHILDRLVDYGVADIRVSVHYLAHQIEDYVKDFPTPIGLVREEEPLGTAGALGFLDADHPDPILILNGDVLSDLDLNALLDHHLRQGCDGTIAAARHEVTVPYGVLEFDDHDTFTGIAEKPTYQHLISAGVYYLEPAVLRLVKPGVRLDMPDLLHRAAQNGMRMTVFPVHEYWTDIGHPEDFARAEERHGNGASEE